MHSDEDSLNCLPLTPGVRILLEGIEKELASALEILPRSSDSRTSGFGVALRVGAGAVRRLRDRILLVLAADTAEQVNTFLD